MRELLFILTPTDGTPVTLTTSPDGWDESFIITERSRKYHGIFRSFTIPLKFVKQGATIIRDEFYRYGMAATCIIQVQKLNRQTLTYFTAYTGKIDFATFKDHDNDIEVMAIDSGLAQIIKTNESTEYEVNALKPNYVSDTDASYIRISNNNFGYNAIWSLTPMDMFTLIMDKVTGGKVLDGTYGVKSDALTAIESWLILSTGQAWRTQSLGKPADIIFKTTLTEFFQSNTAISCLGMGIEVISGKETIVVEDREYFYNKELIKNVGDSKNISLGFVAEFNFSKIIGGYPERELNDEDMTRIEFNTYTNYKTPNLLTPAEYNIESKYHAGFQSIQQIIDTWPAAYTDDEIDYNIHWMNVIKQATPDQFTIATGEIQGVIGTSGYSAFAYNAKISPRRNLVRHHRFINSCCTGLSGQNIEFVSGGNNQSYNEIREYGDPADVFVRENLPLLLSDSDVWFRPLEINIEAAYPSDMVNLIAANPYGVIEFDYKKTTYTGYILKMETKLSGAGSVKYSLLCTDTNDLTKLIR